MGTIRLARCCLSVQCAIAAVIAGLGVSVAIGSYVSDERARRAGSPHLFEGFGTAFGGIVAILAGTLAVTLLVLVVRLRAGRPGDQTAVIVIESLVALPLAAVVPAAVRHPAGLVAWLVLAGLTGTALGAVCRLRGRSGYRV